MADINISRPHGRTQDEAKKIADKLVGRLAKQFDLTSEWEGDVLKFNRSGLNGQLAVTPTDVQITAKLGLLLKPLKGRIESEVTKVLDSQLG